MPQAEGAKMVRDKRVCGTKKPQIISFFQFKLNNVTCKFFTQVVISECSGAVGKFREKSLSINPQKTHLFKFGIHAYGMKGGNNYCVGKEYGQTQYSTYFLYAKVLCYT